MKSAARREARRQFHITRRENGNKVVQNLVRESFVKNAFVAIRLIIKFQTLEFNAFLIGDVFEREFAVVRLTRLRTKRRELRIHVLYHIVALRIRIVKDLKNIGRRFLNDVCRHGQTSVKPLE